MRIYFSGLGGSGIGPLARVANDLGYEVFGSDREDSDALKVLEDAGITVFRSQDGKDIEKTHKKKKIDWFVHTPALPEDHAELAFASKNKIRTSKSGDLINHILNENNLKLLACAGTHGKTTTSAMLSWLFHSFDKPAAHLVGSTLSWGSDGQYQKGAEYLILEADEYDKRFLEFTPYSTVVSSIDYDHPDTYPTIEEYQDAFLDLIASLHCSYLWRDDAQYIQLDNLMPNCAHTYGIEEDISSIKLKGEHNRQNAFLVAKQFREIFDDIPFKEIISKINEYPGVARRFEKIADNLFSDYAHHPKEIKAILELAREVGHSVVAVYQPHQNVRQVQLLDGEGYGDSFDEADGVYWLPTYLTREDPELDIIEPQKLVETVDNKKKVDVIEDMDELKRIIENTRKKSLVVVMGAGNIDDWLRKNFSSDS